MKKRLSFTVFLILFLFLFSNNISASEDVNSEIRKITYYAQEYEIENLDYVKLLIYISESKQNLNKIFGVSQREMGGILKQDQIEGVLGKPTEETGWVPVEGEHRETRVDSPVPIWRKIIFDGLKIQITLEAFPSIFSTKHFEDFEKEKIEESFLSEGDLIYRLNFIVDFKRPEEHFDITQEIEKIKKLAETFDINPSRENAEILARESVNAEKKFQNYIKQNPGKCEDIMITVFGVENQMPSQNLIVKEITFHETEKSDAKIMLEMCDDCDWNWINLHLHAETRGVMHTEEERDEEISREYFKGKSKDYYESEIRDILDSYKRLVEEENFGQIQILNQRLFGINDAWNSKSNDVGKSLEEEFRAKLDLMTQEERDEFHRNYGWIRQNQEIREKEREIRKQNYEERRDFFLKLFLGYPVRESSFLQKEFRIRLVEQFREGGIEICDNNIDDNQNGKIDCEDEQCRGKICGRGTQTIVEGNETKEIIVDFYCIAGECRAKEQILETRIPICGDHICEGNETIENCPEDCAMCPQYDPLECDGRVIFKGRDKNNCPLEPICIEEPKCVLDEDCVSLCGVSKCMDGRCVVEELTSCVERECIEGNQKVMDCESGETIISGICTNGLWRDTGLRCLGFEEEFTELKDKREFAEEVLGNVCNTREDCGRENDICSNGRCVSIPKNQGAPEKKILEDEYMEEILDEEEIIDEEIIEETEEDLIREREIEEETIEEFIEEKTPTEEIEKETFEEKPEQEVVESEPVEPITEQTIKRITGLMIGGITGFSIEENGADQNEFEEEPTEDFEEDFIDDKIDEEIVQDDFEEHYSEEDTYIEHHDRDMEEHERYMRDQERKERDEIRRYEEEKERREREMRERCEEECQKPCVEECIRDDCGDEMDCDIDEAILNCKNICEPERNCVERCMEGGDWHEEFFDKEVHKEHLGVFEVGGSCRTMGGRTEGFVWFGGWGDSFEEIQSLKQKYYSGGHAEWCNFELENLINQRKEFEKGFNQEFAIWFFEEYLANSAENWEQSVSGIFEIYWGNVQNQEKMAFMMNCLGENNLDEFMSYNPIEFVYETEYGKIEYWEEVKFVKFPWMDERVKIISPYMKTWVFPSEEFIKYELKRSMKNGEFPGPPEEKMRRKNEKGLSSEEKEIIQNDARLMRLINRLAEKYGGSMDVVIQINDFLNEEVIFNLFIQISEEDLIKMEPMLPEEVPSKDVTIKIDFEKIYDMIYFQEKEMNSERIETPPWDRRIQPIGRVRDMVNGIRMYFKLRDIVNSAEIIPESSERDIQNLFRRFMLTMVRNSGERDSMEELDIKEEFKEDEMAGLERDIITGKIIKRF